MAAGGRGSGDAVCDGGETRVETLGIGRLETRGPEYPTKPARMPTFDGGRGSSCSSLILGVVVGSEVTLEVTFGGTADCQPGPCSLVGNTKGGCFLDGLRSVAENKGLLNPTLLGIGPEKASLFIFLKSVVE